MKAGNDGGGDWSGGSMGDTKHALLGGLAPSGVEQRPTRRAVAWRWLRRIAALAVLVATSRYLWRAMAGGSGHLDWQSLDLMPLASAVALCTVSGLLGGWVWQLILSALGHRLSLSDCEFIHTASAFPKYLPGFAWQIAGKAYLTRRRGVPTDVVAVGLALEFGGLVLTSAVGALLLAPSTAISSLPYTIPRWTLVGLAGFGAAALVALPGLVRFYQLRILHSVSASVLRPRAIVLGLALGIVCVAWGLLSASLGLTIRSLSSEASLTPGPVVWAMMTSFMASYAAVFAPAGLGVRESVLAALLSARLPSDLAAVVAVLSRLVFVTSEILAFAIVSVARCGVHWISKRSIARLG